MTSYQDLLDDEVGTPPPSTVDVDMVIVRERRRARHQKFGVGAAVGAAVLAFAVVFTMLPRAGSPVDVGASKTPRSATPTVTPSSTPTASTREQEAARLTAELTRIMAETLPGATFLSYPQGNEPSDQPLVFVDRSDHFSANAAIKDSAGRGSISVSIGRQFDMFRQDRACSRDPKPLDVQRLDCRTQSGLTVPS